MRAVVRHLAQDLEQRRVEGDSRAFEYHASAVVAHDGNSASIPRAHLGSKLHATHAVAASAAEMSKGGAA